MSSYKDTIVALSSPPGTGAIGLVRISGNTAIEITSTIFKGKDLQNAAANSLYYGRINDGDELIDEVVISLFKAPHSFTGEDTIEISCHASPYIIGRLLQLIVKHGARAAKPGEFTLKAFLNGKMDLSQAEAVADLIASETAASHKIAIQQLRGGFSDELNQMREELITFASLLELELDFSEEDVEFADRSALSLILNRLEKALTVLIKSFELGNVLKKGIPVAIVGKPNAGKSTLLNQLLKEDRAIVSPVPGTTRDTIEEQLNIEGIPFRLIDTAGLRQTNDEVESIGVERAYEKMKQASIIIYLFDPLGYQAEILQTDLDTLHGIVPGANILVVGNKADLHELDAMYRKFAAFENMVWISARDNQNIDVLKLQLLNMVDTEKLNSGELIINNARHMEALQKTLIAVQATKELMQQTGNSELLAFEIKQALLFLGEITGEVTTDDLLDSIFSKFCIGK